ncbi:unnamed protein product [Aureobasidium uvarum]|uniref:Uncharacterized protein n=1 Tax=Aureobasidium uvarum TaxID=2773716 RepID=A0A9N8KL40_9PEZI|nr:unnamed protein product [Aureobasidium uvarum]
MPPVRTTRSRSDKRDKKCPSLRNMYISVSRTKPFSGRKWNIQISVLQRCEWRGTRPALDKLHFGLLAEEIDSGLGVDITGPLEGEEEDSEDGDATFTLVWRMSESGKFGRVYDHMSLQAVMQDHRRARKHIVELFIMPWQSPTFDPKNLSKEVPCYTFKPEEH